MINKEHQNDWVFGCGFNKPNQENVSNRIKSGSQRKIGESVEQRGWRENCEGNSCLISSFTLKVSEGSIYSSESQGLPS
jgi:hypothetical protein